MVVVFSIVMDEFVSLLITHSLTFSPCAIPDRICHFFHVDGRPFSVDLHHLPNPSASFFLKQKDEAIYQRHHHHHDHHEPSQQPRDTEQQPNQDDDHNKHLASLTHKEYSLFRQGIFPDWEDSHCRDGGCLYTRQYWPPATLDRYWRNLVAGVLNSDGGEVTVSSTKHDNNPSSLSSLMLDATHIVGIRIDDKSKSKHPVYKIEIWLDTTDTAVRENVRNQALAILLHDPDKDSNTHTKNGSHNKLPALKLHWRKFGDIAPAEGDAAAITTEEGGEGDDSVANKSEAQT